MSFISGWVEVRQSLRQWLNMTEIFLTGLLSYPTHVEMTVIGKGVL